MLAFVNTSLKQPLKAIFCCKKAIKILLSNRNFIRVNQVKSGMRNLNIH
jgi:hypothetical protein